MSCVVFVSRKRPRREALIIKMKTIFNLFKNVYDNNFHKLTLI